ncbi:RHS repeat-associated core domain-containing protein [Motilimonas sp. E26]|uniref:RHS repeat domain-containing protein n=1 Tax=Motilimonas sp. E26 TaxID=2865674 RepID=UPI00249E998B|nr:RHS repeat-associated core domain-containing protein [Motilimonas sp. E26]
MYYYNTAGQLLETQYYQGATQIWSKQIIWLGSLPLAQVTQNATGNEIVYLHVDHLNTPRKATNSQQQVVWQWSSDAYGNGAANEDVDGDQQLTQIDLRFPGQLFDAESGLYYNYYRYYDPKTGRYITSDPIGLNGGINTFAYVGGNPVSSIDPKGLWVWVVIPGVCAAGGCEAGLVTIGCVFTPGCRDLFTPQGDGFEDPNSYMAYGDEGHRYENDLLDNPPAPYGFFGGNDNCDENRRNLEYLRKRLERQTRNKDAADQRFGTGNQVEAFKHKERVRRIKAKIKEYEKAVKDCPPDNCT